MNSHVARTLTTVATATTCLLALPAGASASTGPAATASHAGAQRAAGAFGASVDFSSLQARDVRGNKCEFTVDGTLSFTGTVAGDAVGTTTAVIFAPCEDALASPPGTFFDVFRFDGDFTGEVLGEPTTGFLSYSGLTRAGGAIDATIILDGDHARAVLRADARVAVGGTYTGVAKAS